MWLSTVLLLGQLLSYHHNGLVSGASCSQQEQLIGKHHVCQMQSLRRQQRCNLKRASVKYRTICSMGNGQVILHSALDDSCMPVPVFEGPLLAALWDAVDRNVFLLSNGRLLHAYALELTTIKGPGEALTHSLFPNSCL